MYFKSIQFLRFFAALYITFFHMIYWWNQQQDAFNGLFNNGDGAVDLFFVISGFVIAQSITGFKQGWYAFMAFLKKRLIRIFPIYWILLLFFIATGIISTSDKTNADFWRAFFLLPRHCCFIRPSWTLQWELFFYAMAGLLVLHKIFSYLLGTVMVLSLLQMAFPFIHLPIIGEYVAEFFLGMTAWRVHGKLRFPLAVIFTTFGAIFLFHASLLVIASFLLIAGITALEKQGRLKIPAAIAYLGDASYCLYLIHEPLIKKLLPYPATPASGNRWLLIGFVAGLIIIAMALHSWVEKPMLRYLNKKILPAKNEKGGQ